LGTALARPAIARGLIRWALTLGADAVAHGSTSKGNDQVRFELAVQSLAPDLPVIAPWREWEFTSRQDLLEYLRRRGIPFDGNAEALVSRDENLWHASHEGGPLEDPAWEPAEELFLRTVSPVAAPDRPAYVEIGFEQGFPSSLDGKELDAVSLVSRLNAIAGRNGVGRLDLVENRLVGLKSRGVYETPAGTTLHVALRALESLVLDRDSLALKMDLARRYARLVYDGLWFTPLREALEEFSGSLMDRACGIVRVRLLKGTVAAVSRESPNSLYHAPLASFDSLEDFNPQDSGGFIRLFGLPLKTRARLADSEIRAGQPSRP